MLPLVIGAIGLFILANQNKSTTKKDDSSIQASSFNPQLVSNTPNKLASKKVSQTQVPPILATEPTITKQIGGMSIYHF